jgi:hypothetical protein
VKKIINSIADLFPVVLALIFVVVVILTVCHATTSLRDTAKQSSFLNRPDQISVQSEKPRADDNVENAVHSGELEMLVSPIAP